MAEFLPLCDVLFTVISLAGYFCDVVFDLVMAWALFGRGRTLASATALSFVVFSLIVSQVVSLRWYLHGRTIRRGQNEDSPQPKQRSFTVYIAVFLHIAQCGVLWRYARLFVPVDLRHVKHDVRDLCMLRLLHAFCEAAPMLLMQVYLLMCPPTDLPPSKPFSDLNVVSAALSLFSVCWALASFSKNVRLQNVHRLVLTWLGVIFQFFWRLGTVSARVTSLTIYASLYGYWVFLVIGLHWICMFFWLISPKNVFHGERISKPRKACLSALIAFVYVFAYINLQEVNHRQKMVTFYIVMLLENALLVVAWLAAAWYDRPSEWYMVPLLVAGLFTAGIMFMLLYYRYFHVRRLGYEAGGRLPQHSVNSKYCFSCNGLCECGDEQPVTNGNVKTEAVQTDLPRPHQHTIPGVFNCRFSNPVVVGAATRRKKKKPTTFVPPLTLAPSLGPAPIPFWRRPLPTTQHGGSSENEGSSVGSRVNIQQKLQEKKQKQLAELRVIEEEIKQGKLGGGFAPGGTGNEDVLPRQPIPRVKTHVEPLQSIGRHGALSPILGSDCDGSLPIRRRRDDEHDCGATRTRQRGLSIEPETNKPVSTVTLEQEYLSRHGYPRAVAFPYHVVIPPPRTKQAAARTVLGRSKTPEILLAPHYLDHTRVYYDWADRGGQCNVYRSHEQQEDETVPRHNEPNSVSDNDNEQTEGYKPYRAPSDIDSQVSLPRSYTLPREFKYYRRGRVRRQIRNDHFVASTNSSDGDVDSGDDNDSDESSPNTNSLRQNQPSPDRTKHLPRRPYAFRNQVKHETQL